MHRQAGLMLLSVGWLVILFGAASPAWARTITVDGNGADWLDSDVRMNAPAYVNLGHINRNAAGDGEYVWSDAASDERTDFANPDPTVDLLEFRITGDANNLYFMARMNAMNAAGPYPLLQIAIDETFDAAGNEYLPNMSDTMVSANAKWEYALETNFGSAGNDSKVTVYNTAYAATLTGSCAMNAANKILECSVPWSAINYTPNGGRLRFTVGVFKASAGTLWDATNTSDALDAITNYGNTHDYSTAVNTWAEVSDGRIDYYFDLFFNGTGNVYSPVMITEFLPYPSTAQKSAFIEIYNASTVSLDLGDYKISDEETPYGANEGAEQFTAGDVFNPGALRVWAANCSTFTAGFPTATLDYASALGDGTCPSTTRLTSTYEVDPYATPPVTKGWISSNGGIILQPAGDGVLILDGSDTIVDFVGYGSVSSGAYANYVNTPTLAAVQGKSYIRTSLSKDTDSITDFALSANPSPDKFCGVEVCNGLDDDCDGVTDNTPSGGWGSCNTGMPGHCAAGAYACEKVDGVATLVCKPADVSAEICDGIDNNCDGLTDNDIQGLGGSCDTGLYGICAVGTVQCQDGVSTCVPDVVENSVPETCNGLDDDCDGITDNNLVDIGKNCLDSTKKGICAQGISSCVSGTLSCISTTLPGVETCNGLDDDCDGITDNDVVGTQVACKSGVGACERSGVTVCSADGTAIVCNAVPGTPGVETCNGIDDDCNGVVDDNPTDIGSDCTDTTKQGICRKGLMSCLNHALTCISVVSATTETCNGLDDNCDGTVDNDIVGLGATCSAGVGACERSGSMVCDAVQEKLVCDAVPGTPGVETCNGLDDDCDGVTDNHIAGLGDDCTSGKGICERAGKKVCDATKQELVCNAVPGPAGVETCNGLDDDCDGVTDNGGAALCPSPDACHTAICDGTCSTAVKADWTTCDIGKACFTGTCATLAANDTCETAIALTLGQTVTYDSAATAPHLYDNNGLTCVSPAAGLTADLFYTVALTQGKTYDFSLVPLSASAPLGLVLWTGCADLQSCISGHSGSFSYTAPATTSLVAQVLVGSSYGFSLRVEEEATSDSDSQDTDTESSDTDTQTSDSDTADGDLDSDDDSEADSEASEADSDTDTPDGDSDLDSDSDMDSEADSEQAPDGDSDSETDKDSDVEAADGDTTVPADGDSEPSADGDTDTEKPADADSDSSTEPQKKHGGGGCQTGSGSAMWLVWLALGASVWMRRRKMER